MVANSALELCSRLLFSLALVHGSVPKSDSAHGQRISLLPDDVCPCIVREECPRVFGSRPEDELLGSFSPCEDPVSVRCCGVATRISVSSNDPNYVIEDSGDEGTAARPAVPIIFPGIDVPVPFKFPEFIIDRNLPTRRGENSMGNNQDHVGHENRDIDEAISYVKKDSEDREYFDQGKSNSAKSLRGEITEDNVSRIDASLSPDHLDYSRVNKYGVRGGSRLRTITGSRVSHRGEISASKKAEDTSRSSTRERKTESIVNDEDGGLEKSSLSAETLPQSQEKVANSDEVDLTTERIVSVFKQPTQHFLNERFNKLKSSLMASKAFENHRETSSQHKSEVSEEESNFEHSSSARLTMENDHREHREDLEKLRATTTDQELGMAIHSRGIIGHEDRNQGSDQHRSVSIAKELNKVEENISSNSGTVSSTTAGEQNVETKVPVPRRRRRPIMAQNATPHLETGSMLGSRGRRVYGKRRRTSPQQQSTSVRTRSSDVEENTPPSVQSMTANTGHQLDDSASSDLLTTSQRPVSVIRRPTANRGSAVYGQRVQTSTSSQQQRSSLQKESSNLEKNVTTSREHLSNIDSNSEVRATTWRPVSRFRIPVSNRGSIVHGQRKETSSQQQSDFEKKESLNVEDNTSSKLQSIPSRGRVSGVRRPVANRGSLVYGQHNQTSSQQHEHSMTQKSSKIEEITSHDVQSITTNIEDLPSHDANVDLLPASRVPVPVKRRPAADREGILYGQQQQTSLQQQSKSVKEESANVEEKTSSDVQNIATDSEDAKLQLLVANKSPISTIRISTLNEGTLLYGQQQQTTSPQQSNSLTQESKVEENTSADIQSTIGSTGAILDMDLEAAVVRRPTVNRGRTIYGQQQQTSSQQQSSSASEKLASVDEKTSSNFESITANNNDSSEHDLNAELLTIDQRLIPPIRIPTFNDGSIVYGQQQQTISHQRSNSMTRESSKDEENTSSDVQSTVSNTEAILDVDSQAAVVRRPTVSRGRTVYGQRQQTSFQRQSNSASEEWANVEENAFSNVVSLTTNNENLSEHDVNAELVSIDRRPIPQIRIPTSNVDSIVYGQERQTSSQQRSNSGSQESSKVEDNTSSNVKSIGTNAEDVSEHDADTELLLTDRRPIPAIRIPTFNEYSTVYGQQQQTSFQKQSNSMTGETSKVEENTSTDVQSTIANTVASLEAIANSGTVLYGEQSGTTSQQQSSSVPQESSKIKENSFSDVQSITAHAEVLSGHDANVELLAIDRHPIAAIRIPTLNVNSIVHGQQQQTSSHQQSNAMIQESSAVEGNTSSNLEGIISNTGNILEVNSEAAAIRRPTSSSGYVVSGERAEIDSHQQIDSMKQESSKAEENTSSDAQSFITNTGAVPYNHRTSQIVETISFGDSASGHRTDVSGHEESGTIRHESSNYERSTSLNPHTVISARIQPLPQDEAGSQYLDTYGQHREIPSTQEKSETAVKESSSQATKENASSHVHHVIINDQTASNVQSNADIYGADQEQSLVINSEIIPSSTINTRFGQQTESPTKQKNEMNSSEATSSTEKSTTSTSNLWNLNTARQSSRSEAIFGPTETERISSLLSNTNRKENGYVWHVANRTYVPVLINAEFLRDRPVTGTVGPDPVSQVSQSDVWDPNFTPELVPLICGNVLFEERSQGEKTLICDISQGSLPPIRFLEHDEMTIYPENSQKLNGQRLPAVVAPERVQIRLESDEIRRPGSLSIGTDFFSSSASDHRMQKTIETNSMASESYTDESSRMTTVDETKNDRLTPLGNRFAIKRPMLVIAEQAVVPPEPAQRVHRGRIRYPNHRRQLIPETDSISTGEENKAGVVSSKFSKDSLTTSPGSFLETRSSLESVSSSNSEQGITRSANLDVTSTDQYGAERQTEQKNSWLYTLPSVPTLPLPVKGVPEVTDGGELRNRKVVEVVDELPATLTKVSKKTFRKFSSAKKQPLKELQVIMMRISMDNGADVKEAEFVVPEDDPRLPTFFYNRDNRQAKAFAPGVKRVTIPPEKLSMTGRISVVGPLPRGYMDPVLFPEKQLTIDLPVNTGTDAFNSEGSYGKEITSRSTDLFKASPVDPINWQ